MKICQSSQRTWFILKSLQHFLFSEITFYRNGRRTSEKLVGSVWYLQHWSWYWWCLWYAVGCNLLLHRQPAYQSLYPMSGASSRCITLNFDELSLLKQWKQHKLLSSFPLLNSQNFLGPCIIICSCVIEVSGNCTKPNLVSFRTLYCMHLEPCYFRWWQFCYPTICSLE